MVSTFHCNTGPHPFIYPPTPALPSVCRPASPTLHLLRPGQDGLEWPFIHSFIQPTDIHGASSVCWALCWVSGDNKGLV